MKAIAMLVISVGVTGAFVKAPARSIRPPVKGLPSSAAIAVERQEAIDFAIIGGGPAGLAAAVGLKAKGLNVKVFEGERVGVRPACGSCNPSPPVGGTLGFHNFSLFCLVIVLSFFTCGVLSSSSRSRPGNLGEGGGGLPSGRCTYYYRTTFTRHAGVCCCLLAVKKRGSPRARNKAPKLLYIGKL